MIIGVNTSYTHENREYHIQCEDLGDIQRCLEIRVYNQGDILWQKRIPYAAGIVPELERSQADPLIKEQMGKLVNTVKVAISQNKLQTK